MNRIKQITHLLVITSFLGLAGCATAYHQYPCGCVPYDYCSPPPLPYATNCDCPGRAADNRQAVNVGQPEVPDRVKPADTAY